MTKLTQMTLDEEGAADRRRLHLREISGDDLPLETVGQDLRAARVRRGDDLATVSRALKIRKDHLDALEGDRLEDLPGKTYAVGFVRSYARYLGLDAAGLAERYKQEISGRDDEQALATSSIHQDDTRKLPSGWRIVAGFVILALGYGVWHIFFAARDPSQVVPPAPSMARIAQADAPKPPPASPTATVAIPSPALDTAKSVPSNNPVTPTAVPPPAAGPVTIQPSQASAAPQAAVPAVGPGQVYGAQNRNSRVVLRARGNTHIEVRGRDGTVYINRSFGSGDSYRLPDIVGLVLTTTNAGAVEVDLDGMAMGNAGADLQSVGGVSLDPQSIMDRYNNKHA